MSELLSRHRAVIPNWVGIYYDEPIEIVSGKGCRVTDAQGRGYLDFFAGILTNMLGYDVPEVRDAVERQIASGVVHTSTLYLIRGQVELAEKIASLSGIQNAKVFFTNSGTEANETALLAALTARKATEVLAMRGSYHGRSFGAVGVTGNAAWKMSGLSPFGTHYLHGADRQLAAYAGLNDADYIKACVDDLRALLSGGIHPADVEWKLDGVRLQVHVLRGEVRAFARTLAEVTDRVPDVVDAMSGLPFEAAILDGEAIALRPDGRPHPFQVTGSRFASRIDVEGQRRSTPLSPFFFDLLHLDGDDLIDRPARERLEIMDRRLPSGLRVPRTVAVERTGVPGRKYSSSDPALDARRQPQEAKGVCHLRS